MPTLPAAHNHPESCFWSGPSLPPSLRKARGTLRKAFLSLAGGVGELDQKGLYVTLRAGHVAQGTAGLYVPRPENVCAVFLRSLRKAHGSLRKAHLS